MGRPSVKLDLSELEKLYNLQCTDDEVAAFTGVSLRTMRRRLQTAAFREIKSTGLAKGRVSVRRHLFRLMAGGNVAAAIFLSKNLLGYRDVVANEHSGPGGGAIELSTKPDYSKLSDEELQQLRSIATKTKSDNGD